MQQQQQQQIPSTGAHIPEDKEQRLVTTPYGDGTVVRTRSDGVREVELTGLSIEGSRQRPTTLFTCETLSSIAPTVGSEVRCLAGRGVVLSLRKNNQVEVLISSWRLAGRSRVTCFLSSDAVQVMRPKKLYEMTIYEKVERANEFKAQAAGFFRLKDYTNAHAVYKQAVEAVKYTQHKVDSTNTVRADLLVVMVTCSNNAGTCCLKTGLYDEAVVNAQHALSLLEALEQKKGKKIHLTLQKDGHTDAKLFGEWKCKSWMILATGLLEKGETEACMTVVQKARGAIAAIGAEQMNGSTKQLVSSNKELGKLYVKAKEQRKVQQKKEKARARAMFASPTKAATSKQASEPAAPRATPSVDEPTTTTAKVANENSSAVEAEESPPAKKPTTLGDKDKSSSVAWHQDPAFLGGLGALLGIAGTVLVLGQLRAVRN